MGALRRLILAWRWRRTLFAGGDGDIGSDEAADESKAAASESDGFMAASPW